MRRYMKRDFSGPIFYSLRNSLRTVIKSLTSSAVNLGAPGFLSYTEIDIVFSVPKAGLLRSTLASLYSRVLCAVGIGLNSFNSLFAIISQIYSVLSNIYNFLDVFLHGLKQGSAQCLALARHGLSSAYRSSLALALSSEPICALFMTRYRRVAIYHLLEVLYVMKRKSTRNHKKRCLWLW